MQRYDTKYYRKIVKSYREYLLTNLILIGEIPSPTFHEQKRGDVVLDRMTDSDLSVTDCSIDDAGNVIGILPGTEGDRTIMIAAHLDTIFPASYDHTVAVHPEYVSGVGLADNSLSLAVLVSLVRLLKGLEITLKSNIVLLATSKSLADGNLDGIQYYLRNCEKLPDMAICLEGFPLGRLSFLSIGTLRGLISYAAPAFYDWTRFGDSGAIVSMNEIINCILEIPQPQKPRTSIVMNKLVSSAAYNVIPSKASLNLEIRSDSAEMVQSLQEKINNICAEAAARSGAQIKFQEVARRYPGSIPVSHPLVSAVWDVMKSLNIEPRILPSTSELTAFIVREIPAVTLGLSLADDYNTDHEKLQIEPLFDGIVQLIALLINIDTMELDNE